MKYLLSLLVMMVSTLYAVAYEGYGTCKISGTSDYLEGTAYVNLSGSNVSGNLVITNGCLKPLQSASIKVTVNYSWKTSHQSPYDGGKVVNSGTNSTVLYNSRWTGNISGYQSGQVAISGRLSLPSDAYDVNITSVEVSISNAYCE